MTVQPDPNARTQFFLDALQEVVAMSLDIARAIHRQAIPEPLPDSAPAPTPQDQTVPFERAARTIRRAIHLAHVLTTAKPPQPAGPPAPDRTAIRKRIIRSVEDSIQRETSGPHAEALHAEFLDRLDAPDFDDDIANRDIGDVIYDIKSDLGLNEVLGTQPYKRRTPEDIERLRACAAAPPERIRVWLSDKQHAKIFRKP